MSLTFGLKCASGQSECTKTKLSAEICEIKPDIATLLEISTLVDDLGDSKDEIDKIHKLQIETDEEVEQIGLKVKQWTKTGEAPTEVVSEDGYRILVGGVEWFPEVDWIGTRIPPLHFGTSRRGKLDESTEFYQSTGDEQKDLELLGKFCPKLTRRMTASKSAKIWDLFGLLTPVLAGVKCLMRDTVKQTEDWDSPITSEL